MEKVLSKSGLTLIITPLFLCGNQYRRNLLDSTVPISTLGAQEMQKKLVVIKRLGLEF